MYEAFGVFSAVRIIARPAKRIYKVTLTIIIVKNGQKDRAIQIKHTRRGGSLIDGGVSTISSLSSSFLFLLYGRDIVE